MRRILILHTMCSDLLQPRTNAGMLGNGMLTTLPIWITSVVPVTSLPIPDGYELQLDVDALARIW